MCDADMKAWLPQAVSVLHAVVRSFAPAAPLLRMTSPGVRSFLTRWLAKRA